MRIAVVCCDQERLDQSLIENLTGAAKCINEEAELQLWCLFPIVGSLGKRSFFHKIIGLKEEMFFSTTEQKLKMLFSIYQKEKPQAVLFMDDAVENEIAGRLAKRINAPAALHVTDITRTPEGLEISRPAYSGNLVLSCTYKEKQYVLSISKGCFHHSMDNLFDTVLEEITVPLEEPEGILLLERIVNECAHDLSSVKKVVVCGHGVGSKENADKVKEFADLYGFMVAGSRPTIIDGWISPDALVGISGKVLTPDLCILLGVSGAAAFYAGIRKSKVLVAVNTDEDAAILKKCDYVIKEDCMRLVDELILRKRGQND